MAKPLVLVLIGLISSLAQAALPCESVLSRRLEALGLGTFQALNPGVTRQDLGSKTAYPFYQFTSPVGKTSLVYFPKGNPDDQAPMKSSPTFEMKSLDGLKNPTRIVLALDSNCRGLEARVTSTVFPRGSFIANLANCRRLLKFQPPTCVAGPDRLDKDPYGITALTTLNYELAMNTCREFELQPIGAAGAKLPSGVRIFEKGSQ